MSHTDLENTVEMVLGQSNSTIQSSHDDLWTNSTVSYSPKFSAQIAEGTVGETTSNSKATLHSIPKGKQQG